MFTSIGKPLNVSLQFLKNNSSNTMTIFVDLESPTVVEMIINQNDLGRNGDDTPCIISDNIYYWIVLRYL